MVWVFFTVFAAFCQAWRNAFQSRLSRDVNTLGVTLARFLWASPLAAVYLWLLYQWQPTDMPSFSYQTILYVCGAAVMQIVATSLMVVLFKQKNFAVGAGLAKCEAPVAAFLGVFFFGTVLTPWGWLGVALGAIAVLMLSMPQGWQTLSPKTALIGLACSSSFALTSLWVREASQSLPITFPHSAAWVLLMVISLQTVLLVGYLWVKDKATLKSMFHHNRLVVMTSVASFLGSLGWFSAMALQSVPYVKTLGQIEIFFMMLVSAFWLKEATKKKDLVALCLVAIAAMLVMIH